MAEETEIGQERGRDREGDRERQINVETERG